MTAKPELPADETWFPAADRAAERIVTHVCDALDRAMGRDPLAEKVTKLATFYAGLDSGVLVGPHSVAAKLFALVEEAGRG
jgi:hypothetical protein